MTTNPHILRAFAEAMATPSPRGVMLLVMGQNDQVDAHVAINIEDALCILSTLLSGVTDMLKAAGYAHEPTSQAIAIMNTTLASMLAADGITSPGSTTSQPTPLSKH